MKDFTLTAYRQLLLALQQAGYAFLTFEEWCDGSKTHGRIVIMRHDVDLKARHSLTFAQIEAELGIRATYYFRATPRSNHPEIIKLIVGLGHEIGYHYNDLSLYNGDEEKALEHFKTQLAYFRQFYPVRTICMHGSPTSKWDNRDLWKTNLYRDFGIIGEPYFDFLSPLSFGRRIGSEVGNVYFTDTARMWDGDKYNRRDKVREQLTVDSEQLTINDDQLSVNNENSTTQRLNNSTPQHLNDSTIQQFRIHSTFDLIDWIQSKSSQQSIMITTHPQRWTNKPFEWLLEFIFQGLKNVIKSWMIRRV